LIAEAERGPAAGLYLHIPFCETRCPYCDFAIHLGDDQLHRPYVEAVVRELDFLAASGRPPGGLQTLYLGGGTPGLLAPPLLEQLLRAANRSFGLADGAEITLEANPAGLSAARARGWIELGFNRVSLGVQSLDDQALRWLGRNHDGATAEAAIGALVQAGLENFSCDLIYAVPGQSTERFAAGLSRVLSLGPSHLSCYELTVEPGTPLARSVAAGRSRSPSEIDFAEQHRVARELAGEAGLVQYEVSNFARPGRESRHNLGYWQGGHYLGAGCGAHGHLGVGAARRLAIEAEPSAVGVRYWNLRGATTYLRQVAARGDGRRGHESIAPEQAEMERVACGLRLRAGVDLRDPAQLAGARRLGQLGLLTVAGNRVAATSRGVEVLDRITLELVSSSRSPVLA